MSSSGGGPPSEIARDDIERIIRAQLGASNYDPLVVDAMLEYANRFASELLCDAKDYSAHAGHADIELSDAKMAVAMSDTYFLGPDPREKEAVEKKVKVNKENLATMVDGKIWTRYPKVTEKYMDPTTVLLQRTYTLVPSSEVMQTQQQGDQDGENSSETFAPMQMD